MAIPSSRVVFRVAAGPQVGFGHLVRCRSLARAMKIEAQVSLRGTLLTRRTAASMGWSLLNITSDASLREVNPSLVIVDDPESKEATRWVRRARRLGVPVATIHDLGLGHVDSDLVIDGSVTISGFLPAEALAKAGSQKNRQSSLRGPRFAILDPRISQMRAQGRNPLPSRILIALGGGEHVYRVASQLSKAIAARLPNAEIRVARGFSARRNEPSLNGATWVSAPDGLAEELAQAQVAIVAGGVTLYEACALGVPAVAVAVTAAQHLTVRGMVCQGAAIDGGRPPIDEVVISRVADATQSLVNNDRLRRRQTRDARRLVDGLGAFRVVERLKQLMKREDAANAA